MRQPLGFRLYLDAVNYQWIEVEHCSLHDGLVGLEYEYNSDRAFSENFGRMKRMRKNGMTGGRCLLLLRLLTVCRAFALRKYRL